MNKAQTFMHLQDISEEHYFSKKQELILYNIDKICFSLNVILTNVTLNIDGKNYNYSPLAQCFSS